MSNDSQQFQQKIWLKEQEINALKVQNRHLIAKLEQVEASAKPNQINTQQITNDVQTQLRPVISEIQKQNITGQAKIEKALTQAFEMMQATLRGVYQQSQRAQQAVDALADHTRGIESRAAEARRQDQIFYQEKIFSVLVAFLERIERQIDSRLGALAGIEHLIAKQNETLNDVETIKALTIGIQKNTDSGKNEVYRIEKLLSETCQKMLEVEVQSRNGEEITRDALQQIQAHRTEFKVVRGEIRTMIENAQQLNEKISLVDEHLDTTARTLQEQQREQERISEELKEIEAADAIENMIDVKSNEIAAVEEVIEATEDNTAPSEEKEDLVMILDLLRAQKSDLKKVAKEAEAYLKDYRNQQNGTPAPAGNPNVKVPEITD